MRESNISWFQSYVENHKQCRQVDGTLSDSKHINSSMPQSFFLNPLLCAIQMIYHSYMEIFSPLYTLMTLNTINTTLQNVLGNPTKWFQTNNISLNSTKTTAMIFCGRKSPVRNFVIPINILPSLLTDISVLKHISTKISKWSTNEHTLFGRCGTRSPKIWKDIFILC